jgi:hypothetical protein
VCRAIRRDVTRFVLVDIREKNREIARLGGPMISPVIGPAESVQEK